MGPSKGTQDPRRVLGLCRLVISHVVLIRWAALDPPRGKPGDGPSADAGPIE